MPCTAKKFEAGRPEMRNQNYADLDYVLTTRELADMIRLHGVNFNELEPEAPDMPFGERSTAGKIFGTSGGVMEAAYRTAHYLITGENTDELKLEAIRGLEGIKKARVTIGDLELGVAVASGLGNARKLLDEIKAGRVKDIHFIEVMTCPGGCINGGGQPLKTDKESIKARMRALYNIDKSEHIRRSHENPAIKDLYEEYLGKPLSEKSHKLLHTHYTKRDVLT
jgi:iron only hydrogenase large subunit-like protein